MNYGNIKYYDIANGPGVRTSLFVSGCTHHCKNCFNSEAWDFKYGNPFTEEIAYKIIESCKPDYISGLSLLGGEPMEEANQKDLFPFLKRFKQIFVNKTIWCYTGYTYEQLTGIEDCNCRNEYTDEILRLIDVLVDGEFVQELYDISLRFRGSSNQRIIDMNKTRTSNKIVLWTGDNEFNFKK